MMAAVNAEIDRLHSSLGMAESDFFCECGDVACKERVTISRGEYASWRESARPLLVAAHADRESTADTELRELRGKVHQLEGTLVGRANIEQAKGILAERGDMSLQDAFESLRHIARNQRRSLDEVCAEIVAGADAPNGIKAFEPAPRGAASPPGSEARGR